MPSLIRPVLRLNRYSTVAVLARAYAIYSGMAADPVRFADPSPSLSELQAQIAKVEAAYKLSLSRGMGTAAACKVERDALSGMLELERAYVRKLCDASPNEATIIIQAAGMECSTLPTRARPILEVTLGAEPGMVLLRAAVSLLLGGRKKARFFAWQWTTDGGQTFHDAPPTVHGKTTIANLTPLTFVGFRVKATTGTGSGEWSPIVSILIR
jgi:hypothetical protein